MKQSLRLDVSQRLTMTPALQQAIRMLQLSTLDLKGEIQEALESNLMLETEEPEPVTSAPEQDAQSYDSADSSAGESVPDNLPLDTSWNDIYANNSTPSPPTAADDQSWRDYQQANLTEAPDLHDHLAWQADMHAFTAPQRRAADHIIDAVDDNGLLRGWPELGDRLAREYGLQSGDAEQLLAVIHGFDPPGVGARDLAECLGIQLRQLDADSGARELALTVVENGHLDTLAQGDADALAEHLGVTCGELAEARALLQTLQPHPGEIYSQPQPEYVIPEVFVVRRESGWEVQLNPDIAPSLRLNNHYLGLMDSACTREERSTLKSHLREARFFLNSLQSRNDTLLRVAQSIVETQSAFLDYGQEAMQPLVLRDVSNKLDIHESTVSRATANKFMQTPRGIFELKYFFSSEVATVDGGSASSTAIQAMIKRLISEENPAKPLSDNKLAAMLGKDAGITVARRTVAKYREAMAIAPTHQRRRNASS